MRITSGLLAFTLFLAGCTDSITNDIITSVKNTQIVIPPETEVKISKDEIVKVYGFSEVETNDAIGIRKVSNAIVLRDGIDKVDVMIGSPKVQNKEIWRVVREGAKIQLVRPNGFIVEPTTLHH